MVNTVNGKILFYYMQMAITILLKLHVFSPFF